MTLKLNVKVSYSPQHFNRVSNNLIPACWTAETGNVDGANRVYGLSQNSSQEAIDDLITQLKLKNLTGTLKINRVHSDLDAKQMDIEAKQELQNDKVYQSYWL